jgi:hypothetical protein
VGVGARLGRTVEMGVVMGAEGEQLTMKRKKHPAMRNLLIWYLLSVDLPIFIAQLFFVLTPLENDFFEAKEI